ncbi:CaiB/BaiF CoA transferase family protein [Pseudonocardia kunmingensis]|uniref:Crotonobetainyl-CoA:carnitine CoA-transferase CaiB-like acyl-CoA transferase n=1 Tax=Pseudonocardia kunmingensis TaxID=630975 RepID=A0A543DNJ2_9PSEU|nr:CoA transferase [Pseudonocardia kunmingensis]TQM10904.1 crotonobetainyl-CoA:carnitine CoA-transferase CaiB-like acyl-CoA transferase [Pseudonocardia kunmingensis]
MTAARAPLAGIRVLDLSKILAGPYVSQALSDMGADVIKIEHPDGGDPTRRWGPPFRGPDATYHLAVNRNKRSLALDLGTETGQEVVHRLLDRSDVVLDNFRPGSSLARTFHGPDLVQRHPRLVALHISAYGETGPLRDEPGYDMVVQAAAGLMSLTGDPDGPPVKAGFAFGDLGAAMWGLSGVLAALVERERTGRGAYVATSLYESQLAFHASFATGYFATGENPPRLGSGHPSLVPYQAYPTADGYLVVAIGNDAQWRGLCTALHRHDLAADPRYATNADRVPRRAEINHALTAELRGRTNAHWLALLKEHAVPVAPVRSLAEVYDCPQTAALGMIEEVDHPDVGTLEQIALPLTFDGERPAPRSAPPALDQHRAEILAELGVGDPNQPLRRRSRS